MGKPLSSSPADEVPRPGTLGVPPMTFGRREVRPWQIAFCESEMPLSTLIQLLTGAGASSYVARKCPLCKSPTRSFRLIRNRRADKFECVICGTGDAKNFLQRLLGLSAPDGLKLWLNLGLLKRTERDLSELQRKKPKRIGSQTKTC